MHICIDGQPGTGKSTIADILAERFSLLHINSGLWYRALTFFALRDAVKADETEKLLDILHSIVWNISQNQVHLAEQEKEAQLFNSSVENAVSAYADNQELRRAINADIRSIFADSDAVIDGRDAGTEIFPHAEYKFYFTAEENVRSKRIAKRLGKYSISNKQLLLREAAEIKRAKKKPPSDTIFIDTTDLTIDKVFETLSMLIQKEKNARPKR